MSYGRIGVVTGANKGVGLAIVRQLALQYPKSPLNNGSLLIYLTARDKSRGETALESLQQDDQLKKGKALAADGGLAEIKYHALDIADSGSIQSFADFLRSTHPDGVDFVINNAGIALNGFDAEVVKSTLACNYYGTMEASHAFIPTLKPDGRIVNVASSAGRLGQFSNDIRARFLGSKTEDDVTSIMKDFLAAVEQGKEKEAGFPSAAYSTSKAGLIGATRALASSEKSKGSRMTISSCCPGWVVTDMTKGKGNKTPDEGAQTPVHLVLRNAEGQTGEFWKDEQVTNW